MGLRSGRPLDSPLTVAKKLDGFYNVNRHALEVKIWADNVPFSFMFKKDFLRARPHEEGGDPYQRSRLELA
jgi:hypothetical protein